MIFISAITFGIIPGCSSYPKIERNETLNPKNSTICVGANIVRGKNTTPPKNASAYRAIAKMYPRDHKFGPPPSQQYLPGSKWDLSNEYWYLAESGELFLYSNTDDSYVYYWQFNASSTPSLKKHGLLYCAE